jgi:hypothetical protein
MKKFEVSSENIAKIIKELKLKIKEQKGEFLGLDKNLNAVYKKNKRT